MHVHTDAQRQYISQLGVKFFVAPLIVLKSLRLRNIYFPEQRSVQSTVALQGVCSDVAAVLYSSTVLFQLEIDRI